MPNWCENHLVIAGKEEELDKLIEKLKQVPSHIPENEINMNEGYCIFENLYPTPTDLLIGDAPMRHNETQKSNVEKHGHPDWYSWRIDHWGTKWTETGLSIAQEKHVSKRTGIASIGFNFDTAWGPALGLFQKAAEDYPNIMFCLYYQEPGMGFCGRNVWINGEEVESQESELVSDYFDEEYLYDIYGKKENN